MDALRIPLASWVTDCWQLQTEPLLSVLVQLIGTLDLYQNKEHKLKAVTVIDYWLEWWPVHECSIEKTSFLPHSLCHFVKVPVSSASDSLLFHIFV